MGANNSNPKENRPSDNDTHRKNETYLNTGQHFGNNNKTKNQFFNDTRYVQLPYYDQDRWALIYHHLETLHINISHNDGLDLSLIEKTIMSYNSEFINDWNFSILFEFIEGLDPNYTKIKDFILELINLTLDLPKLMFGQPIPILIRGVSKHVTLNQMQCASILANGFFCTFPICNNRNLNSINFNK